MLLSIIWCNGHSLQIEYTLYSSTVLEEELI